MCVYVVAMGMWGGAMCEDGAGGPSSEDWVRGHRLLKPEEHHGIISIEFANACAGVLRATH